MPSKTAPPPTYVSVSSDEGAILSTLLYWVVAECSVARWWTGCVVDSPGLVPGTLGSLPGHPRGGSVLPRSFPPACLQEMQDEGGALTGGREVKTGGDIWEERGVTVAGWRFPNFPLNKKMRCGPARNARSAVIVAPVCQECLQPLTSYTPK